MPPSDWSRRMASSITWLAQSSAARSRSDGGPSVPYDSTNARTANRLATSPLACPPMPSATTPTGCWPLGSNVGSSMNPRSSCWTSRFPRSCPPAHRVSCDDAYRPSRGPQLAGVSPRDFHARHNHVRTTSGSCRNTASARTPIPTATDSTSTPPKPRAARSVGIRPMEIIATECGEAQLRPANGGSWHHQPSPFAAQLRCRRGTPSSNRLREQSRTSGFSGRT